MNNPDIIQITHNFHDALADTISEKNGAIYVKLIHELRDKLGGKIERMIVSKAFWEENWSQVWMGLVFKPVQIPEHLWDGTIKVATFGDTYDVCISDCYDDVKYWVALICSKGSGRMIIEGFNT